MAIGFGKPGRSAMRKPQNVWGNVIIVIAAMTAGTALLMWLGERITEKGVGNGISIVLLINIVIRPAAAMSLTLYERFLMAGKSVAVATVAAYRSFLQ